MSSNSEFIFKNGKRKERLKLTSVHPKLLAQAEKEVHSKAAKIEINNARVAINHLLNFVEEDKEKIIEEYKRSVCAIETSGGIVTKKVVVVADADTDADADADVDATKKSGVMNTWAEKRKKIVEDGWYARSGDKKSKSGHRYIQSYVYKYKNVSVKRWRFLVRGCRQRTFSTLDDAVAARDRFFGGVKID